MEATARFIRAELGDAEIDRRMKAMQARWRGQQGKAHGTRETKRAQAFARIAEERAYDPEPSMRDTAAHLAWGMREERRKATLRRWQD